MKRIAILAVLAFAVPAFAQQQRPSDEEINARIQTLRTQRNAAQDQFEVLAGRAEAEIARLNAEVERLKKACGDTCKPKDAEPKDKPK